MIAYLTGPEAPDLVIISNRTTVNYSGAILDMATGELLFDEHARRARKDGLRRTIEAVLAADVMVLVIRDVPSLDKNCQLCLLRRGECATARKIAVDRYPALDLEVAREFGGRVVIADFTDELCSPTACPSRRRDMITFRDFNHLTATYAATYADHMTRYFKSFSAMRAHQGSGVAEGDTLRASEAASREQITGRHESSSAFVHEAPAHPEHNAAR